MSEENQHNKNPSQPCGFEDYLPLSAVRTAPGEYDITDRSGRVLWRMEGASLARWVCASINSHARLLAAAQNAANFLGKLLNMQGYGEYEDLRVAISYGEKKTLEEVEELFD